MTLDGPERAAPGAVAEIAVASARARRGSASRVALREFDWSGLVQGGFFTGQLAGIVTTAVGAYALSAQTLPIPILFDPPLSAICSFLAFTRVWKTNREESETMDVWEQATHEDQEQALLDRVVEVPYVFLTLALPLTAIFPQVFMVTLGLFYLFDNHYNAALVRIAAEAAALAAGARPTEWAHQRQHLYSLPAYARLLGTTLVRTLLQSSAGIKERMSDPMVGYFWKRYTYNRRLVVLLGITVAVVTIAKVWGRPDIAWTTALLALLSTATFEWILEPRRNDAVSFEPQPAETREV
jgi:hypothetical protein